MYMLPYLYAEVMFFPVVHLVHKKYCIIEYIQHNLTTAKK